MVPYEKEYSTSVYRIFPATTTRRRKRKTFTCREILWVSDTSKDSGYNSEHEKNAGMKSLRALLESLPDTDNANQDAEWQG